MRNGSTVLDRPTATNATRTRESAPATEPIRILSDAIARQLDAAVEKGEYELDKEAKRRNQFTELLCMPASQLCPDQGHDAARGFRNLCNAS